MATKKVIVPIGFKFDDISAELQKVKGGLSDLKLDTNLSDQYNKAFRAAEKQIERIQNKAARGVSTQSEIDGINNELNSLFDTLNRIQKLSGKIKFSDIKLSVSQQQQFNKLNQDLNNTKKNLQSFRKTQMDKLFGDVNGDFSKAMKNIVGKSQNDIKSYSDIPKLLQEATKRQNELNEAARQGLATAQQTAAAIKDANKQGGIESIASQFGKQGQDGKWKFSANQSQAGRQAIANYAKNLDIFSDDELAKINNSKSSLNDIIKTFNELKQAKLDATKVDIAENRAKVAEYENNIKLLGSAFEKVGEALNNGSMREAEKAYQDANQAMESFKQAVSETTKEQVSYATSTNESTNQVKTFKENLAATRTQLENMQSAESLFNRMASSIKQLTGMTAVFSQIRRGVSEAVSQIRELDTAMNGIAVVTDMTNADLWGQINTYMSIAKQYGVTTQGTYQVSQLYYQMGLDANSVMELTTQTLKMAKIANIEYANATDYLTTAMNGFGLAASDAGQIVDVYSKLASIAATDTQELAEAMSRTAAIASSAGMSVESTSAMLTQMIEQTREPAESLGTALKTIIARFQEMKSNPTELLDVEGDTASLNKMDIALSSVGISIKDAQGQFRDLDGVIFELSKIWDTLDRNTQRWIANTAAGSRQQSRFLALLNDNERLQELYTAALDSEDAALVQYASSLDSLDSKLNQLSTSFQQFYMQIANGEILKSAIVFTTNVVDNLSQIGPAGAAVLTAAFISAFQTVGLAGSKAISVGYKTIKETLSDNKNEIGTIGDQWWERFTEKLVPTVKSKVEEAKAIIEAAANGQDVSKSSDRKNDSSNTLSTATAKMTGWAAILSKISSKTKTVLGATSKIAPVITLISSAWAASSDKSKEFNANITKALSLAQAFSGIAQIASGHWVAGLTTISSAFVQFVNAEESAVERLNRLSQNAEKANIKRAETKQTLTDLDSTYKKYIRLRDAQYESNEAYQDWIDYNKQIINDYPTLATTYNAQKDLVADLAGAYTGLRKEAESAYQYQKKISQSEDLKLANDPLYKFSQYGFDTSNKTTATNLSVIGKAGSQEEVAKVLFNKLFPQEDYGYNLAWYASHYGNTSPFDFPNQELTSPNDRSYVAAQLYNLVKAGDTGFQEMFQSPLISEAIDNLASSLNITSDNLIEILRNYNRIIQSGQEKIYSDTQTNINDLKDSEELKEVDEALQDIVINALSKKAKDLHDAGELTAENFNDNWSVDTIKDTLNNTITDIEQNYSDLIGDRLDQVKEIASNSQAYSQKTYSDLEGKQKDLLKEVYGITEENFSEPIELYINKISQIPEVVEKGLTDSTGEFIDGRVYQTLSQLPISSLTSYFNSLSQLFQQTNLGDNKDEIVNGYIDLFLQLSSLGLDYADISSLLADADFSTRTGWLEFINTLQTSGKISEELFNSLQNYIDIANKIPVSIADAEQGIQAFQKKYSTATENLKNLSSSDFDKQAAAYTYFSNLGISSDKIQAAMLGEDINGQIQEEMLNAATSTARTTLNEIFGILENNPDVDKDELNALQAQVAFIDAAQQEAVGTRATNTVQLLKKFYEAIADGDSAITLDLNDFKAIANNDELKSLGKYFEKTGVNTWGLKAGASYKEFLEAVLNIIANSEDTNIGLLQTIIKDTISDTKAKARETDFQKAIQPLINSTDDSGEIIFDKDTLSAIGQFLGDDFARNLAASMDDSLTAVTGEYNFTGTIVQLFDMIEKAIIEKFGEDSTYAQAWKAYRAKNEYDLNQSREYYQAEQELNKVHKAEENPEGMGKILTALKEFTASSDDATEAIRHFGLTAEDFVQNVDGNYGLSAKGVDTISNASGNRLTKQYSNRKELEEEINRLQKELVNKQGKELDIVKATLAARKEELNILNQKAIKVGEDTEDNELFDQPEEFAKNVMAYGDALKELGKTGNIEVRTLANVLNNLGDGSQTVIALGKAVGVATEDLGNVPKTLDAIYASAKTFSTIDGKAMINIGTDLASVLTTAGTVDLKAVAQSNIDMLDGMIATLEALKAIEDATADGSSFSDIFKNLFPDDQELVVEEIAKLDFAVLTSYSYEDGTPVESFDDLWKIIAETFKDDEKFYTAAAQAGLRFDFQNMTPDEVVQNQLTFLDWFSSRDEYLNRTGIKKEQAELVSKRMKELGIKNGDEAGSYQATVKAILDDQEYQKQLDQLSETSEVDIKGNLEVEQQPSSQPVATPQNQPTSTPQPQATQQQQKVQGQAAFFKNAEDAKQTISIDADTTEVDKKIKELTNDITDNPLLTPLQADTEPAKKAIDEYVKETNNTKTTSTAEADTSPAEQAVNAFIAWGNQQTTYPIVSINDQASPAIEQIIANYDGREITLQVQTNLGNGDKSDKRNKDNKNNRYSANANGSDGVPHSGTSLVGELGPELVVSGNQYRVVGQYGAEFVNLNRGDIVFNASDTARLMRGQTGVRGLALANGTGPAYGSGLDNAISALKKARAMWSSILSSVPDMLKKGSGKGGGGGGGKEDEEADKEYLMQLEKWFNWLRRIEELENRITVLRAKRENLKDGKEYAQSLYEENAYLKKQSELYAGLLEEQKAYRKQLQDDYLKNYSKYFYFIGDAIQINADAILADTKNNEELADSIQDLIDDYKDVTEQITDNTSKLEENKTQMDENIRTLRDKYIEMENEVLDALKNMYQKEIDNKQKALDEMQKADEAYLDALRKNLDKEKNLREKSKTREEKETLQRKIALLSRDTSSASAQELAGLRKQLREMQEDQYFTEREDAITSAEDAAQAQQDALQKEIDNLEEANQIKLDNMTLYWEEVANIINQGNENILSFLQSYGESYSEMSKIQQEDYTTTWKQTVDAALEYAKDMQKQYDEIIAAMTETMRKVDTMTTGGLDHGSGGNSGGNSGGSDSGSSGNKNNNSNDNSKTLPKSVTDKIKQFTDAVARVSKAPSGTSKDQFSKNMTSSISSTIKKSSSTTVKKYASGGLVDYTGPAWVDGTLGRPEAFLSADDTDLLKNFLQAARSVTVGLSSSSVRSNASMDSAPTVNVDNVEINITQASLKDDEDLNKLSQDLSQKFLMDIARQSSNISVSRR